MNHHDLCTLLNTIPRPEFLHEWWIFAEADHTAIFEITDCPPGDAGTGIKIQLYRSGKLVATGLTGTDISAKYVTALGPYMQTIETAAMTKLAEQDPSVNDHPMP